MKFASRSSSGIWSAPVQLSAATAASAVAPGSARMDVHPTNGRVTVVWQQGAIITNQIYYTTNRSGTFAPAVIISTTDGEPGIRPDVLVDAGDNAHIVWTVRSSPRRVVYKGVFGGTVDSAETGVSNSNGHSSDESDYVPEGMTLLPPATGNQTLAVAYLASIGGVSQVLYAQRPPGAGQTFGTIVDVSRDDTGAHPAGTADDRPRIALNSRGDLEVLWVNIGIAGVRNVRGNARGAGGSFKSNSDNLTRVSTGDSSSATAPCDIWQMPTLDGAGCLHIFWEVRPGGATNSYVHRYFAPIGVDPSTIVAKDVATTGVLAGLHQLRAGLDLLDDLHVVWEQETYGAARDIMYSHRTAGLAGSFQSAAT
ncbi:MAG: hypothetical protein HY815_08725, partial [Candidatus Riflebacteria bacterium]|nr:hypothetical protein [Candidatus Riflebacteria bacterium]